MSDYCLLDKSGIRERIGLSQVRAGSVCEARLEPWKA